jgi:uncharacterized membrane protein YcaP (DUF421 family)
METVVRASVVFFLLWLLTRGLGKRELAEMTPFDLVLLVVIGDLVQQGVTQEDTSVTGGLIAVGTMGFWVLVLSFVTWRWRRTVPLLEGRPVVIVERGRVAEDVLRCERLPVEEVLEAARQHGIEDLSGVRMAVLEPGGTISFLKDA